MIKYVLMSCLLFAAACAAPGIGDRCEDNESCPEGQYCSRIAVCTKSCEGNAPCPEDSVCKTVDARAVCLKSCSDDDECNDTERCQDAVCRVKHPLEPI